MKYVGAHLVQGPGDESQVKQVAPQATHYRSELAADPMGQESTQSLMLETSLVHVTHWLVLRLPA